MQRPTAAVVGTIVGVSVLVGLKFMPPSTVAGSADGDHAVADGHLAGGGPTAEPPAPSPTSTASSGAPDTDGGGQGDGHAHAKPTGVFRGDAVTNRYGQVKVTLTLHDGSITKVSAKYPKEGHSAHVNERAVPILKRATLKAQSAKIDSVSGATYTSASYKKSLQSALDDSAS